MRVTGRIVNGGCNVKGILLHNHVKPFLNVLLIFAPKSIFIIIPFSALNSTGRGQIFKKEAYGSKKLPQPAYDAPYHEKNQKKPGFYISQFDQNIFRVIQRLTRSKVSLNMRRPLQPHGLPVPAGECAAFLPAPFSCCLPLLQPPFCRGMIRPPF